MAVLRMGRDMSPGVGVTAILRMAASDCLPRICFNTNNFATSAALTEVCALLSAILVVSIFVSPVLTL